MKPEKKAEKLALVIPTRHEVVNILILLERIRAALDRAHIPCEILVVDDDSRDGIAAVVAAAARIDPRIRLLVRRGERGLSGATLHGWQHTGAEILGVMDADLQHPPELLPALFAAILDGRDLALASRYCSGAETRGWNPVRRLLSTAAIAPAKPLLGGLCVRDPLSGFFLVRRRCLDRLLLRKSGFKLLLEILVCGQVRSVAEIPFAFSRRHAGRSKAGIRVALDYLALLARLYRERLGPGTPALTIEARSQSPAP